MKENKNILQTKESETTKVVGVDALVIKTRPTQEELFRKPNWKDEWVDMPEFIQEKQEPYAKIIFRFSCEEDLQAFAKLIGQKLTSKTKSAWYPFRSHWGNNDEVWVDES